MLHSQYLRLETKAGGVVCTPREFIKAAHGVLTPRGRGREFRQDRHDWLRDGLRQLNNSKRVSMKIEPRKRPYEQRVAASGKMGETNDCSVKAVSIACRVPYNVAHDVLRKMGRKHGRGVRMVQIGAAMLELDCTFGTEKHPRQSNGSRWTAASIGRGYPRGYFIVEFRGHVAAMINGVVQDWTDGRRHQVTGVYRVTVPRGSRS